MKQKIYFATINEGKLSEAKGILGIEVIGTPLNIPEIQSLDPIEVAVAKAQGYYKILKKSIFVEDVSLVINHLNGLPGPYIDAFMKSLGNEGIIALLKGIENRTAFAQTTVVYIQSATKYEIFIGKVNGSIAKKPMGDQGFGWDPIFIPKKETRTFAQMTQEEKEKYSMRAIALRKLKKYLNSK